MVQKLDRIPESPGQTAGPYVHIGCVPNFCGLEGVYPEDIGSLIIGPGARGERITIKGAVHDGVGAPLRDALVEIWHADSNGVYPSPADPRECDPEFNGHGRSACDMVSGEFVFETVKPGRVPFRDGRLMAPHVTFWIAARGINLGLQTRMYFADEEEANAEDPVLAAIEHRSRVTTILAKPGGEGVYRFDIRLQGESETIFFDA